MTKKELTRRIKEFIERQDDTKKDEWWVTNREVYEHVLVDFAADFGIKPEDLK